MTQAASREVESAENVAEALNNLSDVELAKLRRAAAMRASYCDLTAEDLLQEAFLRLLNGKRSCTTGKPLLVVLLEALRSIASDSARSPECLRRYDNPSGNIEALQPTGHETALNDDVQDQVIGEKEHSARLEKLRGLFASDQEALDVLDALIEGFEVREIKEMMAMDQTQYATTRRRIRRRINKAYPEGFTS